MTNKFKSFFADDAAFYAVLLICVAITAFGLGRLSVVEHQAAVAPGTISLTNPPKAALTTAASREVVASKNGTKYHLSSCSSAKQITDANLIRFASVELAEAAGYEPAKNCQF